MISVVCTKLIIRLLFAFDDVTIYNDKIVFNNYIIRGAYLRLSVTEMFRNGQVHEYKYLMQYVFYFPLFKTRAVIILIEDTSSFSIAAILSMFLGTTVLS